MKRKDFFTTVCSLGLCTCTGMITFSPKKANAQDEIEQKDDSRLDFVQLRMAQFIQNLDEDLDSSASSKLLQSMGRVCAAQNKVQTDQYRGDLKAYLKFIKPYVDFVELDEANGNITIMGTKNNSCFCPFVDKTRMSSAFCECTKGWYKETYEKIIGKPIEVKILSSVLNGDEGCGFLVSYAV